jgi:hypothetical protein
MDFLPLKIGPRYAKETLAKAYMYNDDLMMIFAGCSTLYLVDAYTDILIVKCWARIFKHLWSPGIDSKE